MSAGIFTVVLKTPRIGSRGSRMNNHQRALLLETHVLFSCGMQFLMPSAALEEKPGASLRFIDPRFEQARCSDVAKFIAQCMSLTHVSR